MKEVESNMSRKQPDPFWTVRGVLSGDDVCMVVEAATEVSAECFATKRGVEVVLVKPATSHEMADARTCGRLWRYTPEPRLRCFGRPIGYIQAALLVICGLATVILDLRANQVPLRLYW